MELFRHGLLRKIERDRAKALKKDIIEDLHNWQQEDVEELTANLCNGHFGLSDKQKAKLRCRFSNKNKPFLELAQLREEDVYVNPRIVLYHDVLSAEDIEMLKSTTEPLLNQPGVGKEGLQGAKTAWLTVRNERLSSLTERAADFSGLDLTYADLMEVLRYDQNGSYNVHLDGQEAITPTVLKSGNKMATILYFLDDSDGGDAVFPALKLTVSPQKGSALFWFNLKASGEMDDLSLHGTCDVNSGTHWEAVKWVRTFGNEFSRPCGMNMGI